MPFARLKLLLVCTLIASTVLFAVGVAIERSQVERSAVPSGEVHVDEGAGGEGGGTTEGGSGEGSSPAEPIATAGHVDSDAALLGLDLESWRVVTIAALTSLGLALAIWFRPLRPVLAITVVFALVFAILDVAEASHQVSASRLGLVAVAAAVGLLHLLTAGLGGATLRSSPTA